MKGIKYHTEENDALMVMKTNTCPVCGGDDIYTDWPLPEANQRQWHSRYYDAIDITRGRPAPLEYYICGSCGYVHSYITEESVEAIGRRWHKVGGKKRVIKRLSDAAEVLGDEGTVNTVAEARQVHMPEPSLEYAEDDDWEAEALDEPEHTFEPASDAAETQLDDEPEAEPVAEQAAVTEAVPDTEEHITEEPQAEVPIAVEEATQPIAAPNGKKSIPPRLDDEQWEQVEELLVAAGVKVTGNKHDPREVVDGIVYKLVTGGSWKKLPDEFPPHRSVYRTFRRWCKSGAWTLVHGYLKVQHRYELDSDPCAD